MSVFCCGGIDMIINRLISRETRGLTEGVSMSPQQKDVRILAAIGLVIGLAAVALTLGT
jgi:hypothetical protein